MPDPVGIAFPGAASYKDELWEARLDCAQSMPVWLSKLHLHTPSLVTANVRE